MNKGFIFYILLLFFLSVNLNAADSFIVINDEISTRSNAEHANTTFKNTIHVEGRCGIAKSGRFSYMINSDVHNKYRVTVRIDWRKGNKYGQSLRVITMEAGGRKTLGCSDSGRIPVTHYKRIILGESKL